MKGPILLPAVLTAAVAACGCTLIGLGIGASLDSSHTGPATVEGWQILRIENGTAVNVFNGLTRTVEEYAHEAYDGGRS